MRKTAFLILVLTAVYSLCSCGKSGTSAETSSQAVAETSVDTSII